MGQRHQAFIIARVVAHGDTKAYYRCLGAIHHQWCYGLLPLRAVDRFLTLAKNPINAVIIREEIESVQGRYGRNAEPMIPDVPLPYSIFLLSSAFNCDIEESYISGGPFEHGLLSARMGCWDGDNNDGITILDITDPLNPSYAFAAGSESDGDLGDEPCTAEDYVGIYHTKGAHEDDEQSRELVAKFASVPFLTEEMLAEAWPNEFGATKNMQSRRRPTRKSIPKPVEKTSNAPLVETLPALADLVVEPAVARSLEIGNTDEVELMIPGKAAQIKTVLRAYKPFPQNGIPLLVSVLKQENSDTLDFSGFSLSPEQLVSVVSEFETTRNVNLSHSPEVKIDHVSALLSAKPEIDRLELLDTAITKDEISSLLIDQPEIIKCVSDIVHPHFLTEPVSKFPGVFTVIASQADSYVHYGSANNSPGAVSAMPVWTPAKVIQNLVDFLGVALSVRPASGDPMQSIMVKAALSTGLRTSGTRWKDRTVPMVSQNPTRIHPDGWVFLFNQANPSMGAGSHKYAFMQLYSVSDGKQAIRIYDVNGFLEQAKKEGRRPLPDPELVKKFQDLVAKGVEPKAQDDQESQFQSMAFLMQSLMGRLNLSAPSTPKAIPATLFDAKGAIQFLQRLLGGQQATSEASGLRAVIP